MRRYEQRRELTVSMGSAVLLVVCALFGSVVTELVVPFTYQGCWALANDGLPALREANTTAEHMNADVCNEFCTRKAKYAMAISGNECSCGNELNVGEQSDQCTTLCADASECGGPSASSVWFLGGYVHISGLFTWEEAVEECSLLNRSLARVDSLEREREIYALDIVGSPLGWFGLNDVAEELSFVWQGYDDGIYFNGNDWPNRTSSNTSDFQRFISESDFTSGSCGTLTNHDSTFEPQWNMTSCADSNAALCGPPEQCFDRQGPSWKPNPVCCGLETPGNGNCTKGNGGCLSDDECQPGLVCGTNNCNASFPELPGMFPIESGANFSCCDEPQCHDRSRDLFRFRDDCCTPESPCGYGNGDCASDDECQGDLVCGTDNCNLFDLPGVFPGVIWDCCDLAQCHDRYLDLFRPREDCCTPANPCSYGNGDCDNDADCQGDLVCGTANCNSLGLPGALPDDSWDCCVPRADSTSAPGVGASAEPTVSPSTGSTSPTSAESGSAVTYSLAGVAGFLLIVCVALCAVLTKGFKLLANNVIKEHPNVGTPPVEEDSMLINPEVFDAPLASPEDSRSASESFAPIVVPGVDNETRLEHPRQARVLPSPIQNRVVVLGDQRISDSKEDHKSDDSVSDGDINGNSRGDPNENSRSSPAVVEDAKIEVDVPVEAGRPGDPYTCKMCEEELGGMKNLKSHMKKVHGVADFKFFGCSVCDRRFDRKWLLKTHMLTHSSAVPYKCSLCQKGFKQRSNFKRHMTNVHKTPFKCPRCPLRFALQEEADKHLLDVHGLQQVLHKSHRKSAPRSSRGPQKQKHGGASAKQKPPVPNNTLWPHRGASAKQKPPIPDDALRLHAGGDRALLGIQPGISSSVLLNNPDVALPRTTMGAASTSLPNMGVSDPGASVSLQEEKAPISDDTLRLHAENVPSPQFSLPMPPSDLGTFSAIELVDVVPSTVSDPHNFADFRHAPFEEPFLSPEDIGTTLPFVRKLSGGLTAGDQNIDVLAQRRPQNTNVLSHRRPQNTDVLSHRRPQNTNVLSHRRPQNSDVLSHAHAHASASMPGMSMSGMSMPGMNMPSVNKANAHAMLPYEHKQSSSLLGSHENIDVTLHASASMPSGSMLSGSMPSGSMPSGSMPKPEPGEPPTAPTVLPDASPGAGAHSREPSLSLSISMSLEHGGFKAPHIGEVSGSLLTDSLDKITTNGGISSLGSDRGRDSLKLQGLDWSEQLLLDGINEE